MFFFLVQADTSPCVSHSCSSETIRSARPAPSITLAHPAASRAVVQSTHVTTTAAVQTVHQLALRPPARTQLQASQHRYRHQTNTSTLLPQQHQHQLVHPRLQLTQLLLRPRRRRQHHRRHIPPQPFRQVHLRPKKRACPTTTSRLHTISQRVPLAAL